MIGTPSHVARAALVAAGILAAGSAGALTLNFDQTTIGGPNDTVETPEISSTLFSGFGVTLQGRNLADTADKVLALYDSSCFGNSCEDPDLYTGPNTNSVAQNQILILNQGSPGAPQDPPNDDASGGIMRFTFDGPVVLDSLMMVDIDEGFGAVTMEVTFGDLSTQLLTNSDFTTTLTNAPYSGDNSLWDVGLGGLADVIGLDVRLQNVSGAIASVTYAPAVPLPAGLPLALTGAAALWFGGRRRKG